ncbi:molybdate ABC transporter substrate-binding protein [Schinkia azotoformans]|nr:molybdate ABC transporter substrate-binding protein [Schinkia azotoformans]MEC1694052.1 molybdate ABC transporter substrate-binding protein [Schinkia azotoformans]MEC1724943.1 molybdate ABC transporter substrate-binding protein [Schinkia azotoformans]MEC1781022.1 molybdate ABC transporter substrate-binding protein [Schinkia azotoformans]MED4330452.1 molybdate ABC transporter substrate-binding protein [Schinkia azotoformans]
MGKRISIGFLVLLFIMILSVGCSQNNGANNSSQQQNAEEPKQETLKPEEKQIELMISAAASLTDALNEMKQVYENEHSSVKLAFNFGGSGKLATQIEQGAPTDLFLSADQKSMDNLEEKSLITVDSRADFTGNKIVLVGEKNNGITIPSFKDIDPSKLSQIAIGEPESVPAGKYAKEALEALGKWDEVQTKLVYAKDVRQVLTYVESGNVDVGFVYSSDALTSDKVKVLAEADATLHTPIIYPVAIITDSENQEEAQQFIDYLLSEDGQNILKKYGFVK